jgi:hypothetical protein
LKYGYTDRQLEEVIQNVAGYDATNISYDKWSKFIQKRVEKKKV